jgi:hypothetical protein
MTSHPAFHILTVGWNLEVIRRLADPVEKETRFAFSHIVDPSLDRLSAPQALPPEKFHFVREDVTAGLPPGDTSLLAALERDDVPTIHNMIMGDRLVRNLPYEMAISWATFLARRFEELFVEIRPSVVIGGFDGLHSGLALAVARKLNIPWFAINFTAIPLGLAGFCKGMSPGTVFSCRATSAESLRQRAEATVGEFEARRLVVPTYLSANDAAMIVKRLPAHFRAFWRVFRRVVGSRFDPYTQVPPMRLVREYARKRANLFRLSKQPFLTTPPTTPYLFIGLHMQPESSIDVWAPFFSDQFAVIESIARANPPDHLLLVKLHKSDADNYSPRQLARLRRLPGVQLVSPYVSSRDFIEKAALVLAIQGNIAMEGALLGRPVLFFGESRFTELPSVTKVGRVTDLPRQIREKLSERPPGRESILQGLVSYLSHYAPGCSNDWEERPSAEEIRELAEHFKALRGFVSGERSEPAAPVAVVD